MKTARRFRIEEDRVTFSVSITAGNGFYAAVVRPDGSVMLPNFASEEDPERINVLLKALIRAVQYGIALKKSGQRQLPNFFAGLKNEGWEKVR